MGSLSIGFSRTDDLLGRRDGLQEVLHPDVVVVRLCLVLVTHSSSELLQGKDDPVLSHGLALEVVQIKDGITSGHFFSRGINNETLKQLTCTVVLKRSTHLGSVSQPFFVLQQPTKFCRYFAVYSLVKLKAFYIP